jgi:hypothetical protein
MRNTLNTSIPSSGEYIVRVKAVTDDKMIAEGTTEFKIDITPPSDIEVVVSQRSIKVGEIVRLVIQGDDKESGLSANYYISIDGAMLLPVGGIVFIPFSAAGTQELIVRIFDRAGNYVDRSEIIRVGR